MAALTDLAALLVARAVPRSSCTDDPRPAESGDAPAHRHEQAATTDRARAAQGADAAGAPTAARQRRRGAGRTPTSAETLPEALQKRKAIMNAGQSTERQVLTNLESKRRQYDLVESRAATDSSRSR